MVPVKLTLDKVCDLSFLVLFSFSAVCVCCVCACACVHGFLGAVG